MGQNSHLPQAVLPFSNHQPAVERLQFPDHRLLAMRYTFLPPAFIRGNCLIHRHHAEVLGLPVGTYVKLAVRMIHLVFMPCFPGQKRLEFTQRVINRQQLDFGGIRILVV